MAKDIKSTKMHLKVRNRHYVQALVVVIAAISIGVAVCLLYITPKKLSYSTSQTITTIATPQSVSVSVSGRYATIHYFSGLNGLGGANATLKEAPTMSAHGKKVINISIELHFSDAIVSKRNTEYSVKIKNQLNPGKYNVEVTATQIVGLSAGAPASRTLTTSFEVY